MAAEIFRSRRDLGENLDENLGENLDAFLAAEILRSRQDLVENLDEIFGEISPRSRSKFCRGDHFTVVGLVTWPLNGSEAAVDLVLIQTSLLLLCKSSCSYAN